MVQSPARITRKSIRQPDKFLVFTGKALEYYQEHQKALLLLVAALLLLGLGFGGFSLYRERQQQLAATDFERALALFHSGKLREALTAFDSVVSHRFSPLRGYALLYQANSHIGLNEHDKAIGVLETLTRQGRIPLLRQMAFNTLGYTYETRGQWKEAARSYGEAHKIDGPYKEDALLSKGRCEVEAQDYKQALDSYKSYLTTYPNAPKAGEVSLKVHELEAKLKS